MDDGTAASADVAASPNRSAHVDELRPVTAVFADVVGSTGLGERLDAAEVKAVIGECVSRMCEAIEAFGGVVTGQMGDGIAAFFGLRVAREDDALRAARAAVEIRSVVTAFAEEVRRAWGVENLNVRIGVNSGRVAAGPVGGQEPTVIALGDAVNVAARLQAAASPGSIVVGASVATSLTERFIFTPLGLLAVKGRTDMVEALELVGLVNRPVAESREPFVGRANELRDALVSLAELDAGRGQVVTVVGDGGIGKTRLLEELRKGAGAEVTWLHASCDSLDHRLPYEPVEQLIRGFLDVDSSATDIQLRTRFRAVMERTLGAGFDDRAPQLARILGIKLEERLMKRLDGLPLDVLKGDLHVAVAEWLASIARDVPTVVVIDNLHDAHDATADLVSFLIEQLERLPILIVLTMRPDPTRPAWRARIEALANHSSRCQDIGLRPLDESSARSLIASLDSGSNLSDEVRDLVARRAEGNPLYIEQLVAAVRSEHGGGLTTLIPRALESFLLARIDALSVAGKRILQSAAVLGRTFSAEVVVRMSNPSDDAGLAELLKVDLVKEHSREPRRLTFRHGLLRDAALSTLTPTRLSYLHARAAQALENWENFDVARDGQDLARHLMASGGSARAAECLEACGDRLVLTYRTEEACECFGRALEIHQSAPSSEGFARVARKLCDLYGVTGETARALAVADQALSIKLPDDAKDALLLAKATRLHEADRLDEATQVLAELLDGNPTEAIKARGLILRGWLAIGRHELSVAKDVATSLSTIDHIREIAFEHQCLSGGIAAASGRFVEAFEHMSTADLIASELGHLPSQLLARRRKGVTLRLLGEVGRAFEVLNDVYVRYESLGFLAGQLETVMNLAGCALFAGELERGRKLSREMLRFSKEPAWRAMISTNLGMIEVERGAFGEVTRIVRELVTVEQASPGWVELGRALLQSFCLRHEGDLDGAEQVVRDAVFRAREVASESETAVFELLLAEIAIERGDWREALERALAAGRTLDSVDVCTAIQCERVLGAIETHLDVSGGVRRLNATLDDARRLGMRLEEARCLLAIGEVDASVRGEYFAAARKIFEECGSKLGLSELERAERSAPDLSDVSS